MDVVNKATAILMPVIEKRIITPIDMANPPADYKEGKFLIFLGGGNGSGKTTLTNFLFEQLKKDGYNRDYVAKFGSRVFDDILSNKILKPIHHKLSQCMQDAVDLKTGASGKPVDYGDKEKGFLKKVALNIFTRTRQKSLEAGVPIIMDYHMDDPKFVEECVNEAKKYGYQCIMLTPHIDAENIIPRLEDRQKKCGKPYIVGKAIERHRRFAANLDEYLKMFDLSIIMDNNQQNLSPSVIAISHNGNTEIFNEGAYKNVQRKRFLSSSATNASDIWQPMSTEYNPINPEAKPVRVGKSDTENSATRNRQQDDRHFVRMIEKDFVNNLVAR